MANCNNCKYFMEKGEACEFAQYKEIIDDAKSSMEEPCNDTEYLEYLLNDVDDEMYFKKVS